MAKIGIITLGLNDNFGGILQNYALQTTVAQLGHDVENICIETPKTLSFANQHIKMHIYKNLASIPKNFYDYIIVGGDQIWNYQYAKNIEYSFAYFAKDWDTVVFSFSASAGEDLLRYPCEDMDKIIFQSLNQYKIIGVREKGFERFLKTKNLNSPICFTPDPCFLLEKDKYNTVAKKTQINTKYGFYLLDRHDISYFCKQNRIDGKNSFKPQTIEDFLAMYRDCEFIITDSFHGCIFAMIYNKPFICIKNKQRGAARFNTIADIYNISDRIVDKLDNLIVDNFSEKPNARCDASKEIGIRFLTNIVGVN